MISRALAESAVARSDTSLFYATIDSELVGTVLIAVIDVESFKVASLFMDSYLEHVRGKGVHRATLMKRIRVARECSGSARNIERAGLRGLFICKMYTKDD